MVNVQENFVPCASYSKSATVVVEFFQYVGDQCVGCLFEKGVRGNELGRLKASN